MSAPTASDSIVIVGLGPAGLDRIGSIAARPLHDPERRVVVRTLRHPAAAELASQRAVWTCDDLYDELEAFDDVYGAITRRVVNAAREGPVTYAVPGSPVVGERTVPMIRSEAHAVGLTVAVVPGESFLDLAFDRAGIDPIAHGVQVVDGRDLPDPLAFHLPMVITQVDTPVVAADVAVHLGKVLQYDTEITVLDALGSPEERVFPIPLSDLARIDCGPRTSLFVDRHDAGWHGLVVTNRRLRRECPWDRTQTHHSLVGHLIEETYETVEAILALDPAAPGGEVDFGAYAELEEELGDLLLQVVFHATLARETGVFDVEEIAEGIRRKLIRRHPHVFGDVEVAGAAEVIQNWDRLKADEKQLASLMDDVPAALPAIARADKVQRRAATVGFDWDDAGAVMDKVREEIEELSVAATSDVPEEIGDVLFAVVNLARHLGVDPEVALRLATDKFMSRFRSVEQAAASSGRSLAAMTLEEMDLLWESAKG